MRKIGKTRSPGRERPSSSNDVSLAALDMRDQRPQRVAGATISGWSASLEIDLGALFARPPAGASIASGVDPGPKDAALPPLSPTPMATGVDPTGCPAGETVSLSDGTSITFATADQFETVNSV